MKIKKWNNNNINKRIKRICIKNKVVQIKKQIIYNNKKKKINICKKITRNNPSKKFREEIICIKDR